MADAAGSDTAPDIDPLSFARLAADPSAAHLGISLEQVRPGYARASMTVGADLLDAVGKAHGGVTVALLDVVHAAVHRSTRTAVHRIEARADDGRLVAAAPARVFRTGREWATEGTA